MAQRRIKEASYVSMKHSFNFLSGLPLWPVGWRERSPVALAKSNQIRADQCERATEFLRSLLVGLGGACIDDAIEWRLSLDSFASEGTKLLRLLRSLVPRLCRPIWVVKMFFSISWRGSKGLKRAVLAVSWSERSCSSCSLISLYFELEKLKHLRHLETRDCRLIRPF